MLNAVLTQLVKGCQCLDCINSADGFLYIFSLYLLYYKKVTANLFYLFISYFYEIILNKFVGFASYFSVTFGIK